MKLILNRFTFLYAVTLLMGTKCQKEIFIDGPKQEFVEKLNLFPAQKSYSINDTIWLHFQRSDKTLFDTISRQRLPTNAVKFLLNIVLLAKYEHPSVASGRFCDFIFPANATSTVRTAQDATVGSLDVGCDNTPSYDVKVGVVMLYKGYYTLDLSSSNPIHPCPGQNNPYTSSIIRFTYNLNDTNKDVYLNIPASARKDFPVGYTEGLLDAKMSYAFRVQ